ncbi:FecR domain-containing protein [Lysobacter sp. Root690]|uniref:FecR family protein n=1 Tax=Lysobacter sp. Root690 TaxID=1736588 RepID=UPI0006FDFA11|nr:FecR domain-containing protein [Lysobacter sp. Root690]KRB05006.1 hypothetical protein ASD86_16095 [Lysobacter sp. Root690]
MAGSRQIERDAAAWLARRDGGDWSPGDQMEFDAWIAQSTAHRVAWLRLRAAWAQSDRLKALAAGVPAGEVPARGAWSASPYAPRGEAQASRQLDQAIAKQFDQDEDPSAVAAQESTAAHITEIGTVSPIGLKFAPRVAPRRPRTARYAAVAAIAVIAVSLLWGWQRYGVVEHRSYRTAMGALDTIGLADGSRATLSSDSRIDVALSRAQRNVALEHGEAFFDVAKDPGRPFAVDAGARRVIAVGTRFSVRRDGHDLRVVVTEGTVRLESEPVDGRAQPTTLLPAGSIALAGASGVLVRSGSIEDAERYVDWRNGYLVFRDTALSAAVAEFNRYNTRRLVIGDAAVGELRVGGNFRWSNAEVFVGLLEQAMPVRAERLPDRIVLHSR